MGRRVAILVRHGDYHQLTTTPSAHQPFPLTALGEQQAAAGADALVTLLQQTGWQLHPVVHCSQMLRAWQTARRLIRPMGLTDSAIHCHDALAERSVGAVANLSITAIEEILAADERHPPPPTDWKSNSHYRLPFQGAESLYQAGERVADHLQTTLLQLPSLPQDQAVLFVGHGAAIRHAAVILGVLTLEQARARSMFHATPVAIERTPPRHWHMVAGEWKMRPLEQNALPPE